MDNGRWMISLRMWIFNYQLSIINCSVAASGGLAQLARALAWHARGHRFDPDILHHPDLSVVCFGNHNY